MRTENRSARKRKQMQRMALFLGAGLLLIAVLGFAIFGIVRFIQGSSKDKTDVNQTGEVVSSDEESVVIEKIEEPQVTVSDNDIDQDDPQFEDQKEGFEEETEEKAETDENPKEKVESILQSYDALETGDITYGVDVAKYQGTIDWSKVAASGVQFAMVRVGYRTQQEGVIMADTNAKYNMQEAQSNGIKLGAYFFSTAVSEAEAVEEANWVADYISQYQITYPVAYNCEGFNKPENRQYTLSQTERTNIAKAFLNQIYQRGYTPMFYAAKGELVGSACWDTPALEGSYKMWLAYYPGIDYDYTKGPGYAGSFQMWQYSSTGKIDGIKKNVDVNIAYFGYSASASAKNETAPETAKADAEALMNFKEVNEIVTAKSKTNLRDIPSQGEDSKVLMTLVNPDTATRTGISDSGWSRLVYGDQVCYAVSSYLTTDTSAPAQSSQPAEPENAIKTKFTACDDIITAKQEVNLRTLPSVTNEQSAVAYTLHNGETVHRTGYNQEYGWSRVELNGQVLYCVTSYTIVAQ